MTSEATVEICHRHARALDTADRETALTPVDPELGHLALVQTGDAAVAAVDGGAGA